MRYCVHVEGPDGAGKSTLVDFLSRATGAQVVPTDGPPKTWLQCLERAARRLRPGTISDRSSGTVSELVYGPVIRGFTVTPEEDIWDVVRAMAGVVVFVYCRPPFEVIRDSHRPRDVEDPAHLAAVADRIELLVKRYDEVFERMHREGCRIIRYDWTRQTPEEVLRCVAW